MKHNFLLPAAWGPLLKQYEMVNSRRHLGTIKSGPIVIHTLVKETEYIIFVYNASKDMFEKLGRYRFIGEDGLNYQFEKIESSMSMLHVDFKTITLLKMCDDRYFFVSIQSNDVGVD